MGKKKEKPNSEAPNIGLSLVSELDLQIQLPEAQDDLPNKKSKKHKRKRSSKEKKHQEKPVVAQKSLEQVDTLMIEEEDQEILIDDIDMDVEDSLSDSASGTKLQIKTPETAGEKNLKLLPRSKSEKSGKCSSGSKKSGKRKDGSKGEEDTDSEEERWLDAIESGKLEEVDDELKRMKNPRLMTARQRAMMEKRADGADEPGGFPAIPAEPLLALPTGFKEKVLTEEMLAKKAIKSKRRREQAIEKREEDKKKTVDRLLKKQDSKGSKAGLRAKGPKMDAPVLTYLDNREGIFLSFPVGMGITPIAPLVERNAPKPTVCGVDGCYNLKKYSCSDTNVPLCSLACYKRNLGLQDVALGSVT